ncbi:MAG: phage tail tape measure protein, partial [Clostridia bacterium]|nr:phage tail tape measure protein [Clostridia bacterium]
ILAMSGYDANQSISMIEDVLHLAAAGSMEMGDAAGFISGALKGFNDETKDSRYYADLMAKGATLANTSVSQLGEAMASGAAGAAAVILYEIQYLLLASRIKTCGGLVKHEHLGLHGHDSGNRGASLFAAG